MKFGKYGMTVGQTQAALKEKAAEIDHDLAKWDEVILFMKRWAENGDQMAGEWVQEVTAEIGDLRSFIQRATITGIISGKMFTERNRVVVNGTIQRACGVENYISKEDWAGREFILM